VVCACVWVRVCVANGGPLHCRAPNGARDTRTHTHAISLLLPHYTHSTAPGGEQHGVARQSSRYVCMCVSKMGAFLSSLCVVPGWAGWHSGAVCGVEKASGPYVRGSG